LSELALEAALTVRLVTRLEPLYDNSPPPRVFADIPLLTILLKVNLLALLTTQNWYCYQTSKEARVQS